MKKKVGKKKELTEKEKTKLAWIKLLVKILSIILITFLILYFVIGIYLCHDNNMFPKVCDGDLAITLKLGKNYSGDIIVYKQDNKTYFGRVVAVEGDTINITGDGTYTVNGTIPYEVIYYKTNINEKSNIKYPYTLKEGELFVLNDMRDNLDDSRLFGSITKAYGKVVLLFRRRGF